MSTPATKRPLEAGRRSPNGPSSPARGARASTPDRGGAGAATASGAGSTTPNGTGRTRTIRSSTLVSGRAGAATAAHRRDPSRLSTATSADVAAATEAQEAARAETVALLDDLKSRLTVAESQAEQFRRQSEVQQTKLDEAQREHARLEERAHEYDEQVETLKNDKREMSRQMQQMETIYEAERSSMTREKEDMSNREEEMQAVIQRLKDSLAQRNASGEDEGRASRQATSPNIDNGSFAPPSSLQRSDSRNNSKLLLQKDKLIESLRLELAEAQIKLVESENQGGGRLREVERQLMEARMANARLMEDNESYQLLLQEKTLKGDFGTADFGYSGVVGGTSSAAAEATASRPRSSNQDALNALEGRGSSLADELSGATGDDSDAEDVVGAAHGATLAPPAAATDSATSAAVSAEAPADAQRRLEAELKTLQDQNKALTLYINKIIERLLEHQDYQYILDKSSDSKQPPSATTSAAAAATTAAIVNGSGNTNKELPPAPLQRAKTMAATPTSASRPRQRPMSVMHETALNHPDTAPSIPLSLARGSSVRRGRPMSEQITTSGHGSSAASVVNAMYKGSEMPLSPTFRNSGYFLAGAANGHRHGRHGSGSGSTTISGLASGQRSPGLPSSGNFPGMRSETSSMSGDMAGSDTATSPPTSSTHSGQSPPRYHEKTAFTGTKPRPLRLVQENTDSVKAETANKRASWIGWAFGKKDDTATAIATEPIQE